MLLNNKEKNNQIKDEFNIIKNWIDPHKNVELNLIFKKSRDGDSSNDFHKYCNNKGNTLILIETKEGRKFGGFTHNNWEHNDTQWRCNKNDFVFSLDLNKKYINICENGCSTFPNQEYGPTFGWCIGSNDVDILFKTTLNEGYSYTSRCFNTEGELNNRNEKFETKELEVYEVNIK